MIGTILGIIMGIILIIFVIAGLIIVFSLMYMVLPKIIEADIGVFKDRRMNRKMRKTEYKGNHLTDL